MDAIEGVIPILQTPFDDSGQLDLDSLQREVTFLCEAGVDGVAFPGFVSERCKLSDKEIAAAAEVILAARKGDTKAIFNVTAQSTYHAVRQATVCRIGMRCAHVSSPFCGFLQTGVSDKTLA